MASADSLFSEKIMFDYSCETSVLQTIHMTNLIFSKKEVEKDSFATILNNALMAA